MDFLNRSLVQLRDLFLSMTPGARITSALLLGVIVVSLAYLFKYHAAGHEAYLMDGQFFRSGDIAQVEAALGKALLTYERDGSRLRIPRGQHHVYMAALADAGAVPPEYGDFLEKALNTKSPFENRQTQTRRYNAARQQELSRIIGKLEGIETAQVVYAEAKGNALNNKTLRTATVSVKPVGRDPLSAEQIHKIRKFVLSAFAGLKNVTVMDANGGIHGGGEDGIGGASDDPWYNLKNEYESKYRDKIQKALRHVRGAWVEVAVDLTTELNSQSTTIEHGEKGTVVENTESNKSSTKTDSRPGGRPGVTANGSSDVVAIGKSAAELEDTSEESRTRYIPSTTERVTQTKGMTLKDVTVSIGVPSDYYIEVWNARNPTSEGEEPTTPPREDIDAIEKEMEFKFKEHVARLLPGAGVGNDPLPRVQVTTFQSLVTPPIEGPTLTDNAVAWTGQNWSTISMTGLALFSLVMLRSMVKSVPTTEAPTVPIAPTLSIVSDEEEVEDEEAEGQSDRRPRRRLSKGPTLRDDLADMVKEDPEAAANILRNWIGNVG